MNPQLEKLAKEIGNQNGEMAAVFLSIVNVLRQQPNFDDEKFKAGISELIEDKNASDFQRGILSCF